MFLDLPDLDLQVRGMDPDPDPPIVMQNSKKKRNLENFSVADPGSGIGCLFDPWIRDPGWEKVSILIRDPG